MSEPSLVINLSISETGMFTEGNDILQRDAIKRLDSLIIEQVNGISEESEDSYAKVKETSLSYRRIHNAMLIEGGRGSGKTTFLLNALHRLNTAQKLDKSIEPDIAKVAEKLYVLPMIDPTLIETKENIIIVILSMIEAAIADVADKKLNWVSGITSKIPAVSYEFPLYTLKGKSYLPLNEEASVTYLYSIDPATNTAKKGLKLTGIKDISGVGILSK